MSSSDPPSRIPPRGQSHETKAAREELSSKGKVEKVREVDADETRKRKFLKFYEEDQSAENKAEAGNKPTPFDLYSQKSGEAEKGSRASLGNVDDAIVASPPYTPPPDLSVSGMNDEEEDNSEASLPQSDDFWEEVDLPPDQPVPQQKFQETERSLQRAGLTEENPTQRPSPGKPTSIKGKKELAPSPFEVKKTPEKKEIPPPPAKKAEKKKLPTPFEEMSQGKSPLKGKEQTRYLDSEKTSTKPKKKGKEEELLSKEPETVPLSMQERHEGGGHRGREQKTMEIAPPSLPALPPSIQPMAAAAATQASSYLHPSTIPLFFQMVGTIYVMTAPPGVSRTEITLNNPAFASSKFYGATITIEKYATAPDSFNIRLTGSDEAVNSFRDQIPTLMNAFQNGNFTFKVNRLDAEYTSSKPVFRRKGKEEENKGDHGGFGERRK